MNEREREKERERERERQTKRDTRGAAKALRFDLEAQNVSKV